MKKSRRIFLFSIPVILALLFSTVGAIPVYADDVTPPPETTEEAVIEEPTDEAPVEQETVESPSPEATESPEPVEDGQEPTSETTPEATVEETLAASEEPTAQPTPELSDDELDTLPEILGQVPEGTELIVLDAEGKPESLASKIAAETLVEGDPVWCPAGNLVPTQHLVRMVAQ